jgi:hypothetical protein
MTFVIGFRLKGLTLCLTGGLAALPLVFAGTNAARAQWEPPRVAVPPAQVQQPSQPLQLPQTLPQAGSLTPMCCPTSAPPAAATPAAAAPAPAPARRD